MCNKSINWKRAWTGSVLPSSQACRGRDRALGEYAQIATVKHYPSTERSL